MRTQSGLLRNRSTLNVSCRTSGLFFGQYHCQFSGTLVRGREKSTHSEQLFTCDASTEETQIVSCYLVTLLRAFM